MPLYLEVQLKKINARHVHVMEDVGDRVDLFHHVGADLVGGGERKGEWERDRKGEWNLFVPQESVHELDGQGGEQFLYAQPLVPGRGRGARAPPPPSLKSKFQ